MKKTVLFFVAICLCALWGASALAQTNPAAQTLPFTLTSQTGNTLPAGVAAHRFGTTAAAIPTTRTTTPGNADLPYSSISNAGGWRDEGANGIGILASGAQAAGALIVAIDTTGQTNVQVSWVARTILQQASRDNSLALQYRLGTSGNFIDIDPSTYTSAGKTAGDFATFTNVALPVAAENQPVVQVRWIYWESVSTSGSRDRIAVDDISITASSGPAVPTVIVSTPSLPDFGNVGVGGASAPKSYTVSGSTLSAGITVTAPADFQVSTTSGSGYTSSLTLPLSSGSVPQTTIYVRFTPTGLGPRGGNVTNESAGADTKNVAVSGTGVNGHQINGTITRSTGAGLASVPVNLQIDETTIATTTTDAGGNYIFNAVAEGGDYTVVPAAAGFTFTPPFATINDLAANQTANFTAVPQVIISEFRTQGATADDDFVELYNQTDQPVSLTNFTLGLGIAQGTGNPAGINLGGMIPARGHFLLATSGYTLGGAASADQTIISIELNSGVVLISSSGPVLDAAGSTTSSTFYREGAGLAPVGGNGQYSHARKLASGAPQDTDDNAADFVFVATDGGAYGGTVAVLGAPGPENAASPIQRGSSIPAAVLDGAATQSSPPNRVRNLTPVTNGALGTLSIRRAWTNNTGLEVSRLRFRIIDVTTFNSPNQFGGALQADLRALDSVDVNVTLTNGSMVPVRGTVIETPPAQPNGGGLNSTVTVTLAAPLPNGATINTQFLFGVQQSGKFSVFVNVEAVTQAPPSSSVHLTMGNPSNAISDINQPTNYLMLKQGYALAYHRDRGTPVWTSWHLDSSWLGGTSRQDDFRADTTLPAGWYQVQGTDYSGSGYDRGHMTPSGDRTISIPINSETFLMTNMIPQLPANNQGPWASFESYCRTLVGQGNEVYIISGGTGTQGTIANGNVTVPSQTWKVAIVIPSGTNDVSRVTTSTRTIAILLPNSGAINTDWRTYRVSVDQIETLTGFNFFSNVDDTVENVIEATVDNQ